jgi:hypothetical protein
MQKQRNCKGKKFAAFRIKRSKRQLYYGIFRIKITEIHLLTLSFVGVLIPK